MSRLGKMLQLYLAAKDMTQAQLAEELGTDPVTITRLVQKGQTNFHIDLHLRLIAWVMQKDE